MLSESLSGIRGNAQSDLPITLQQQYATAYFQQLSVAQPRLVVGYDTRPTSAAIAAVFIHTWQQAGAHVINLGVASTPLTQFAVQHLKADGGVIITASHNQPNDNGWKLLQSSGAIIDPGMATQIIAAVHAVTSTNPTTQPPIAAVDAQRETITQHYCTHITNILTQYGQKYLTGLPAPPALDPNGGSVIEVVQLLAQQWGIDFAFYGDRAGVFERVIEPNQQSLAPLAATITAKHIPFACGFDCDADRMEIVLPTTSVYMQNHGQAVVSGNYILALCVESVLKTKPPGQIIIVSNATSQLVHHIAANYQAQVIEVDVGEINVVTAMKQYHSPIGGEGSSSGAIIDGSTCRDGLVALALIARLLGQTHNTLDEQLAGYPVYYELREKISFTPSLAKMLRTSIIQHYQPTHQVIIAPGGEHTGVKILLDQHNWLFFRASQTESGNMRIIVNGTDKKKLTKQLKQATKLIEQIISSND